MGQIGPPAAITGAATGATGFTTGVVCWYSGASHAGLCHRGQLLGSPGVLASMGLGWVEEVRDMGEVGLPSGQESLWEVEGKFTCGGYGIGFTI